MNRDEAINAVRLSVSAGQAGIQGVPDQATTFVDALASLGLIKFTADAARCEPPAQHADRLWHWVIVHVRSGVVDERRSACAEWRNGRWYLGSEITPEQAAAIGWRYIGPADEPKIATREIARDDTLAQVGIGLLALRCVPPNLPLPTGMHLLRRGSGMIRALWNGDTENWIICSGRLEGKTFSPEEASAYGFEYHAALPEHRTSDEEGWTLSKGPIGHFAGRPLSANTDDHHEE